MILLLLNAASWGFVAAWIVLLLSLVAGKLAKYGE
jgi:hypothetical protein